MIKLLRCPHDLLPSDLLQHSIWREPDFIGVGVKDNEDWISPSIDENDDITNEVAYVSTTFILKNNAKLDGFVRISDGKITWIRIFLSYENCADHLLNKKIRLMRSETCLSFAKTIGLPINEVFPLVCHLNTKQMIKQIIICDDI